MKVTQIVDETALDADVLTSALEGKTVILEPCSMDDIEATMDVDRMAWDIDFPGDEIFLSWDIYNPSLYFPKELLYWMANWMAVQKVGGQDSLDAAIQCAAIADDRDAWPLKKQLYNALRGDLEPAVCIFDEDALYA